MPRITAEKLEERFFHGVLAILGLFMTSFVGWMAYSTWQATVEIPALRIEMRSLTATINSVADELKEVKGYNNRITESSLKNVEQDRRLDAIERRINH